MELGCQGQQVTVMNLMSFNSSCLISNNWNKKSSRNVKLYTKFPGEKQNFPGIFISYRFIGLSCII